MNNITKSKPQKLYEKYVELGGNLKYLFGASYIDWDCISGHEKKVWKKLIEYIEQEFAVEN